MPILFEGAPGSVVAINDKAMQGVMPLASVNPGVSFQSQKSLITSVTIAQEANYQFLHTLGGDIYIYVFGDRVGQMTISGLSVAKDCRSGNDNVHGFEKMLQWYKANKLSARKTPVTAMIGKTPITGFVAGMQGGVFDHRLLLMQFSISLMILPEKQAKAGAGGGIGFGAAASGGTSDNPGSNTVAVSNGGSFSSSGGDFNSGDGGLLPLGDMSSASNS